MLKDVQVYMLQTHQICLLQELNWDGHPSQSYCMHSFVIPMFHAWLLVFLISQITKLLFLYILLVLKQAFVNQLEETLRYFVMSYCTFSVCCMRGLTKLIDQEQFLPISGQLKTKQTLKSVCTLEYQLSKGQWASACYKAYIKHLTPTWLDDRINHMEKLGLCCSRTVVLLLKVKINAWKKFCKLRTTFHPKINTCCGHFLNPKDWKMKPGSAENLTVVHSTVSMRNQNKLYDPKNSSRRCMPTAFLAHTSEFTCRAPPCIFLPNFC